MCCFFELGTDLVTDEYIFIENPEDELSKLKISLGGKFMKYAPDWKGPITPEESVNAMRTVIDKASVEAGDGGAFISHFGTKKWL